MEYNLSQKPSTCASLKSRSDGSGHLGLEVNIKRFMITDECSSPMFLDFRTQGKENASPWEIDNAITASIFFLFLL